MHHIRTWYQRSYDFLKPYFTPVLAVLFGVGAFLTVLLFAAVMYAIRFAIGFAIGWMIMWLYGEPIVFFNIELSWWFGILSLLLFFVGGGGSD